MRIATYNVEWFNALFDDAGELLADDAWSARWNVTRADQIAALAIVFNALDADAVMVIEAPDQNGRRDTVPALERFAAFAGLRARKAVIGFGNDTQQEIALLYDPDTLSARHDPQSNPPEAPRFDGAFRWDLDVDAAPESIRFSKPPLELAMQTRDGFGFRMIGVHAKSKAPHGAKSDQDAIRISIQNRRKQLAQCIWLRHRVSAHLSGGDPLIVLGDFNDGPGLDEYEKLFGKSGVEIVLGTALEQADMRMFDPHARLALQGRLAAGLGTARFYLSDQKRFMSALLDYVMVSPDLRQREPNWRIWHPFDDPDCYTRPELREALLTASDHFPVTVDLNL